jgi:hypothetical protein
MPTSSAVTVVSLIGVMLATAALAEPLERQRYLDRKRVLDLLQSPAIADQQTIDEVEAMRHLDDREGEFITGRSYGCGPVLRPRPGPFEP